MMSHIFAAKTKLFALTLPDASALRLLIIHNCNRLPNGRICIIDWFGAVNLCARDIKNRMHRQQSTAHHFLSCTVTTSMVDMAKRQHGDMRSFAIVV